MAEAVSSMAATSPLLLGERPSVVAAACLSLTVSGLAADQEKAARCLRQLAAEVGTGPGHVLECLLKIERLVQQQNNREEVDNRQQQQQTTATATTTTATVHNSKNNSHCCGDRTPTDAIEVSQLVAC